MRMMLTILQDALLFVRVVLCDERVDANDIVGRVAVLTSCSGLPRVGRVRADRELCRVLIQSSR